MDLDFGGKGIDTQQERQLINYDPVLRYVKEASQESGSPVDEGFVPSPSLRQAMVYSVPQAITMVEKAQGEVEEARRILAARLAGVKVAVDDPKSLDVVKSYTGGSNEIPFSVFDRACRDSSSDARYIVQLYQEHSDRIEAMLYPDCVALGADLDNDYAMLTGTMTDLMASLGYDVSGNLADAVQARIQEWMQTEARSREVAAKLQALSDPASEEYQRLEQQAIVLNKVLFMYEIDPTPTVSRVVYTKAQDSAGFAGEIRKLLERTVSDMLDGAADRFLERVLVNIDTKSKASYGAKLQEVKKVIGLIRKLLRIASSGTTLDLMSATSILSGVIEPYLRSALNQVMSSVCQLKVELTAPVMSWLAQAYEDPLFSLLPLDHLANTIMDVMDGIEAKFDNAVLDAYRLAQQRTRTLFAKIELAGDKKWLSDLCDMLEKFEQALDSIEPDILTGMLAGTIDPHPYINHICRKMGWLDDSAV